MRMANPAGGVEAVKCRVGRAHRNKFQEIADRSTVVLQHHQQIGYICPGSARHQ